MHGQALKRAADRRQPARRRSMRAETLEQAERRIERVGRRRIEPAERARIAAPPKHVKDHRREIDAGNLRLAMRPQPIARIPQANHAPCPHAARAAGPLVCRVLRHALGLQAVDAAVWIVPRHLVQAGVDDAPSHQAP